MRPLHHHAAAVLPYFVDDGKLPKQPMGILRTLKTLEVANITSKLRKKGATTFTDFEAGEVNYTTSP